MSVHTSLPLPYPAALSGVFAPVGDEHGQDGSTCPADFEPAAGVLVVLLYRGSVTSCVNLDVGTAAALAQCCILFFT